MLATGNIFVDTIWQGMKILNNENYQPKKWHGTLFCWAVLAVAIFINTEVSGLLPMTEGIILVLHTLGFISILVPLVFLSPRASTPCVFKTVLNEGGTRTVILCPVYWNYSYVRWYAQRKEVFFFLHLNTNQSLA